MKQHVVHDQVAVRYADDIDHAWAAWEPQLRRCDRLFGAPAWRSRFAADEVAAQLRRAQYQAHVTSELASGLVPPPSAVDAHAFLVATLASCRDALGVLAVRAELEELDEDTAELGLYAVNGTREGFNGARSSTALVHAWIAEDQVDPEWIQEPQRSARIVPFVLWMLIGTCAGLFVVLLLELFVLGSPGG